MAKPSIPSLGGRARADQLTTKQLSEIGQQGAEARNQALSKAQRSALARHAAQVRWGGKKKKG